MNIHVKYQSSSTHCSKTISKVKVFKKWVKLQGQDHKVKNNGLITRNTRVKYQSLALTVQKLLARLKFSKNGSNSTARSRLQDKK